MKNSKLFKSVACLLPVTVIYLLSGCASYNAAPLTNLSPDAIQSSSSNNDVIVAAKAFDKADCKKHLDRDVLKKGYQPVQLYIQNNSDKNYLFSLNRITLPFARPELVADKVHTSTVGRAVGYGAAAWFTFGLFAIPAIVDGVKSSQANDALDRDFSAKTAKDQIILPHSHLNTLIFVPVSGYQPNFTITLIDQDSNEPKAINVTAQG